MKDHRHVLGFLADSDDNVLLMRRHKPDWQQHKYNGIGGRMLKKEHPLDAMKREWIEKTKSVVEGIERALGYSDGIEWRHFCRLHGNNYEVFCFAARCRVSLNQVSAVAKWGVSRELDVSPMDKLMANYSLIHNVPWMLLLAFRDPAKPEAEVRAELP